MKKLHLVKEVDLPIDALMQPIALLGNRGGGKTYGGLKIFEVAYGAGVQSVAIDIIGKWWAVRLGKDGKSKGLDGVYIFGGKHADFPIQPDKGAFVARVLVEKRISAVIDLSLMRKGERRTFLQTFFEEFYLLKKQEDVPHPSVLFLEEAHAVAPQKPQPDEARMLGAVEDLVREGRNAGIGVVLMDQRPATVNKNCLALVEVLIALRTTYAIDRKVYEDWIVQKDAGIKLAKELPFLKAGEGFLYAPVYDIYEHVHILPRTTYDSSATAKVGEIRASIGSLTPIDLEAVRESMSAVVAEAESSDPRALRRRVAELEAKLAKAAIAAPAKVEVKEVPVLEPGAIAEFKEASEGIDQALQRWGIVAERVKQAFELAAGKRIPTMTTRDFYVATAAVAAKLRPRAQPPIDGEVVIKKGAREMLKALAIRHPTPLTRREVGTLSRMKSGSGTFSDYLSALRKAGYICDSDMGDLAITQTGLAFITPQMPETPQTTDELVRMWGGRLKRGARAMLDYLVAAYPQPSTKEDLGAATGLAPGSGTFSDYLSALRTAGLMVKTSDGYRASDTLFPNGRAA